MDRAWNRLSRMSVRVHATFVGIDDVYAQTVHWWHAYTTSDIVFAVRFIDMVTFQPDESAVIDYTKFISTNDRPSPPT